MTGRNGFRTLAALAAAAALATGCAGLGMTLGASGDPAVEGRKKLMRGIAADMKRLQAALKQGSGWVVGEQVRQAAGDMYKKAGSIKKAFAQNTLAGKTTASPAIWQERQKFAILADRLAASAAVLAQIHHKGGPAVIKRAVGQLGRQCGACHRPFRVKKN